MRTLLHGLFFGGYLAQIAFVEVDIPAMTVPIPIDEIGNVEHKERDEPPNTLLHDEFGDRYPESEEEHPEDQQERQYTQPEPDAVRDGLYFVLMEFERTLFLQFLFGSHMLLFLQGEPLDGGLTDGRSGSVIPQSLEDLMVRYLFGLQDGLQPCQMAFLLLNEVA